MAHPRGASTTEKQSALQMSLKRRRVVKPKSKHVITRPADLRRERQRERKEDKLLRKHYQQLQDITAAASDSRSSLHFLPTTDDDDDSDSGVVSDSSFQYWLPQKHTRHVSATSSKRRPQDIRPTTAAAASSKQVRRSRQETPTHTRTVGPMARGCHWVPGEPGLRALYSTTMPGDTSPDSGRTLSPSPPRSPRRSPRTRVMAMPGRHGVTTPLTTSGDTQYGKLTMGWTTRQPAVPTLGFRYKLNKIYKEMIGPTPSLKPQQSKEEMVHKELLFQRRAVLAEQSGGQMSQSTTKPPTRPTLDTYEEWRSKRSRSKLRPKTAPEPHHRFHKHTPECFAVPPEGLPDGGKQERETKSRGRSREPTQPRQRGLVPTACLVSLPLKQGSLKPEPPQITKLNVTIKAPQFVSSAKAPCTSPTFPKTSSYDNRPWTAVEQRKPSKPGSPPRRSVVVKSATSLPRTSSPSLVKTASSSVRTTNPVSKRASSAAARAQLIDQMKRAYPTTGTANEDEDYQ